MVPALSGQLMIHQILILILVCKVRVLVMNMEYARYATEVHIIHGSLYAQELIILVLYQALMILKHVLWQNLTLERF